MNFFISSIFWFIVGCCIGYVLAVISHFIYVKVINKKILTPFQAAGYTKDTKFRVLVDYRGLYRGDIVTLDEDDGTVAPWFKNEDGSIGYMYLPNMAPEGQLEVLEVHEEEV